MTGSYDVAIHGPNGFLRGFSANFDRHAGVVAAVETSTDGNTLVVKLANRGAQSQSVTLRPLAYIGKSRSFTLQPGESGTLPYPVAASDHWYDFAIELPRAAWSRRFAGHIETGQPSRSDPALTKRAIA